MVWKKNKDVRDPMPDRDEYQARLADILRGVSVKAQSFAEPILVKAGPSQDWTYADMEPVITRNNAALSLLDVLTGGSISGLKFGARKLINDEEFADGKGSSKVENMIVAVDVEGCVEENKGKKRLRKMIVEHEDTDASNPQREESEETLVRRKRNKKDGSQGSFVKDIGEGGGTQRESSIIPIDVAGRNKNDADSEHKYTNNENVPENVGDKNVIYAPDWKVMKNGELNTDELRRSFIAHCLPFGERNKLSKKKNYEISHGIDDGFTELLKKTFEAPQRWGGMMMDIKKKNAEIKSLKKKNADLTLLCNSVDKIRKENDRLRSKEGEYQKLVDVSNKEKERLEMDLK